MNYFLVQAILLAAISDEEGSFWTQLLVFLFVVVFLAVYSFAKNDRSKRKDQQKNRHEKNPKQHAKSRWRFRMPQKTVAIQKGMVQEYISKIKNAKHHSSDLAQEPKLDFDSPGTANRKNPKNQFAAEKNKDLRSGMELLELDFLLSVIENIEANDQNDVTMRKLNFNEVCRRKKLSQVKSNALKAYAINRDKLYSKNIQCEAMRQLAERTTHSNKPVPIPIAVYPRKRQRLVKLK